MIFKIIFLAVYQGDKKELSNSVKVNIIEKPAEKKLKVLETNWQPETTINEGARLDLFAKVDRLLEPSDVLIYKDAELSSSFQVNLTNDEATGSCSVELVLLEGRPEDSGALKLCIKNERRDLVGSTKLTVVPADNLAVVMSDWKPQVTIKEGESLTLTLTVNRPLKDLSEFSLFKGKTKLVGTDGARLEFTNRGDVCDVKLVLVESIPPDTGKYRLVYKDAELAATDLSVEEIALKVVKELAADKGEYLPKEEVRVSFVLSKPVGDKDKCLSWLFGGKAMDLKSKQVEVVVEDRLLEGVVYTLVVKACEQGKHDGEFINAFF